MKKIKIKQESKVKKKGNVQSVKSKEREKKNYVILSIRRAHKKAHTGKKEKKAGSIASNSNSNCVYICVPII
jgi:hypothetical protein